MKKKKELVAVVLIAFVMIVIGILIGYSLAGKSDNSSVTTSADISQLESTSDSSQTEATADSSQVQNTADSSETEQASDNSETAPTVDNSQSETTVSSAQSSKDGLSIMSLTEDGDWIVVETSYGVVRYPFAFSDVIEVEAFNEGETSQLRFYTKIEGEKIKNYTIHYNADDIGTAFGTLKQKNEIPLSVVFEEFPEDCSEEWMSTFYAVQETFNDILKSMQEDKNFTLVS